MNNEEAYYLSGWLNVWLDGFIVREAIGEFGK